MAVEAANSDSFISGLVGTIKRAAQNAGASFEYLLSTAKVESGLNVGAQAPTSSAQGLFQFIEQTWLGTMKESGPSLGLGQYANAINRTPSGAYTVPDPAARAQILNLRNDPAVSTAIAGAYTQRNASDMTAQIGRQPTEGELYIAHFLGSAGATRMVQLAQTRPESSAVDAFPYAAGANRSIFYNAQGEPRTIGQVYNALIGRYQTARNAPATAPARPQTGNVVPDAESFIAAFRGEQGGLQDEPPAKLGDSGPAFYGLFKTPTQRGAVAPVVAALWGAPEPVQGSSGGGGSGPVQTLNLFRDEGQGKP